MAYLLSGVLFLFALTLLGHWFAKADPAKLAGALSATVAKTFAVMFGIVALMLLFWTGAIPWLIAAMASLIPWLLNAKAQHNRYKAASGHTVGGNSSIRTDMLRMAMDNETGEVDGEVVAGEYRGYRLSHLGQSALLDLLVECGRADPQSVAILEAYLDRRFGPDWRGDAGGGYGEDPGGEPPRRGRSGMSRQEALEVLGLEEGAGAEAVKAAHRRLMQTNHPDRGGSTDLATKINEAKDVLLRL